jgi:hypothetical protein
MFGMSDAHHFRKMVAGFCMMAAPLLALVGFVIHPEAKTDEAAQIGVVSAHMDTWYAAHMFLFAGVVLAVPAVLGLMHMLREREVAYGHLGGAFGLIGLMAIAGIIGIEMTVWQMGDGASGEMAALLDRVNHANGIAIPFLFGSLLFGVGMTCLAYGLFRAKLVAPWMAFCLAASGILLDVSNVSANATLAVIGAALALAGQGAIGWMVWRESDEAWEHPSVLAH